MFVKSLVFATLLSGSTVLGAPLVPTPTDASGGDTRTVSVSCAGKDGANTCSPSESAAINNAVVSILPVVEGKPGWTVVRQEDGNIASLTIEGQNDAGSSARPADGELGEGEAGANGFWDWFGKWRYDYAWGIGPK